MSVFSFLYCYIIVYEIAKFSISHIEHLKMRFHYWKSNWVSAGISQQDVLLQNITRHCFLKDMPLMVPKEMRMQLRKIFDPIVTIWFVARRIPIRWRTQKLMDYIKCTLCCPSNLPCSYTRQKMNQHSIWHRTEIKQGDFWKTTLKKERQQIFFRFVAHTLSCS